MVQLSGPLLALNILAVVVCLCTLYSFGPESKEIVRAWLVEQYLSLAAFTVVVLAGERFAMATFVYLDRLSEFKIKPREYIYKIINDAIGNGYVFNVSELMCGAPAEMTKGIKAELSENSGILRKVDKDTAIDEPVLISNETSQSGTPVFEESSCKDEESPSAHNDDACSADTTM